MSLSIKRKQIVLAGLVVALSAAMYVNWYYTKPAAQGENIATEPTIADTQQVNLGDAQYVNAAGVSSEFFSEAQLKRSQAQDEAKQTFISVVESDKADEASKQSAKESLDKLSQKIILQSEIESLIKAKTGGEVFVTLGDTAEILLSAGTLTEESNVQIKDIISNKTEVSLEKITIVEVK